MLKRLFTLSIFLLALTVVASAQVVKVKRVVDGDTFIVEEDSTDERVRILYVDTPESVHPDKKRNTQFGKLASEYTKQRLEGKLVSLVPEVDHETEDVFDRKLMLVYINGTLFNLELIREGYSPYYTKYGRADEPMNSNFETAEKMARDAKKGIWSDPKLTQQILKQKSKWGQKHPKTKKKTMDKDEL